MIAVALSLVYVPLTLKPGFRTFPEIATLVGRTPTEIKCDPAIAHRAAFVAAESISKAGLLQALGLETVTDGEGRRLKDANRTLDREWAGDVRGALRRSYEEALAIRIRATPIAQGNESTAGVRALAEFPSDLPAELMERGSVVDTRPTDSLSRDALRALKHVYPDLQGGEDSLIVRRRTLGGIGSGLMLTGSLKVADPGIVVDHLWPEATIQWPERAIPAQETEGPTKRESMIERLRRKIEDRSLRLRRFESELSARRGDEMEGRALVAAITAEIPVPRTPLLSLSQVAELWAKRGRDVILELDPATEMTEATFDGDRLRPDGDWSPHVVEGVLVLRPLLRFAAGERRYPYRAMFSLEAAGVEPLGLREGARWHLLDRNEIEPYVRHAGPTDLWEDVFYRGWWGGSLDRSASHCRVGDLVPASLREASERRMAELMTLPKGTNGMRVPIGDRIREYEVELQKLPPATLEALAAEMRVPHGSSNAIVYSPAAWARFVRLTSYRLTVYDSPVGPGRSIGVWAPSSAFEAPSPPGLHGLPYE